jgi:hypothetical protein
MAGPLGYERRASARVLTHRMEGMERARLRPGRSAHILNLSSGGALIESDWRLLPGTRVDMQVGDPVPLFRVAGRIVRCHVTRLDRERIRYRAALKFEKPLPFGEAGTHRVDPGT